MKYQNMVRSKHNAYMRYRKIRHNSVSSGSKRLLSRKWGRRKEGSEKTKQKQKSKKIKR